MTRDTVGFCCLSLREMVVSRGAPTSVGPSIAPAGISPPHGRRTPLGGNRLRASHSFSLFFS